MNNKVKNGLKVFGATLMLNFIVEVVFNWPAHLQAYKQGSEAAGKRFKNE